MQPPQHLWRHRVSMPSMARHKRYAAMAHYLLREHCPIRHCMHTSRGTLCPGFHLLRIQSRMQPAILHSQAHPRHWRLDSRHRTVHVRVGRRPVSMCACLHCWSSQPRDFIAGLCSHPAYATHVHDGACTVRERLTNLSGGEPLCLPIYKKPACQYTRSGVARRVRPLVSRLWLYLLARHATTAPVIRYVSMSQDCHTHVFTPDYSLHSCQD